MSNPYINIRWQEGPVSVAGENGAQIEDAIEVVLERVRVLNAILPCTANDMTEAALEKALYWQEQRNRDRLERGVEGTAKE